MESDFAPSYVMAKNDGHLQGKWYIEYEKIYYKKIKYIKLLKTCTFKTDGVSFDVPFYFNYTKSINKILYGDFTPAANNKKWQPNQP